MSTDVPLDGPLGPGSLPLENKGAQGPSPKNILAIRRAFTGERSKKARHKNPFSGKNKTQRARIRAAFFHIS